MTARPISPHGDMATCMNGRCPRTAQCWRYRKPAAPRQSYADFAGGDDCADFVAVVA